MTAGVVVLDYGVGNLFSVRRALEQCGAEVRISGDPAEIMTSPRLVLPGVGAFSDGMKGLKERGLDRVVRDYAGSGRPLLGICLGMQMLATVSEEFGMHEGLDIVPGRVVAIANEGIDGKPHKIPHIGWAELEVPAPDRDWRGSILKSVKPGEAVYMVHSYTVIPENAAQRLADCHYDGVLISAAVRAGNVYGCQFHPEKSAGVGLRILSAFLELQS
jgi:glutamine amidotransferase